jgi:hypothetical protein
MIKKEFHDIGIVKSIFFNILLLNLRRITGIISKWANMQTQKNEEKIYSNKYN